MDNKYFKNMGFSVGERNMGQGMRFAVQCNRLAKKWEEYCRALLMLA